MEEPICLIENKPDQKLQVNLKALSILQNIKQPVVVVAIVGLYRTGKSYLMNKLAGKDKGFSLGATIQAETTGIWMWCFPHPEKRDHTLVLLDTEGLGDVEKSNIENDSWIFALSILLSSTFVYNSMGTIDQFALEKLQYVTELTKRIKVKSSPGERSLGGEETYDDFVRFFPAFIWVVRDFTLRLKLNDGRSISSDEYLENALKRRQVLGKLTVEYVEAISKGAVPCIENAVVTLARIENGAAVQDGLKHYGDKMQQLVKVPTETVEELLGAHAKCEKEAIRVFLTRAFRDEKQEHQKQLANEMQARLVELCSRNQQASLEHCQAVLAKLFQELEEKIRSGSYSVPGGYQRLLEDQRKKLEQYDLEPKKGIMASKALQDFLKSKEATVQSVLQADLNLTEQQKKTEVEQIRAENARREAEMQKQMKDEAVRMAQKQQRSFEEHKAQLMDKMREDRRKLMEEHNRVMNQKLEQVETPLSPVKMEASVQNTDEASEQLETPQSSLHFLKTEPISEDELFDAPLLHLTRAPRKRKQRVSRITVNEETPLSPVKTEASEQLENPQRKLDFLKPEPSSEDEQPAESVTPKVPQKKKQNVKTGDNEEWLRQPTLTAVYQFALTHARESYDGEDIVTQGVHNTVKVISGLDPYLTETYTGLSVQARQSHTKSIMRAVLYCIVQQCSDQHFQKLCWGCSKRSPSQKNHDCLMWTQFYMNQQIRRILKALNLAYVIHLTVCVAYALKVLELKQDFVEYLVQQLSLLQKCSEPKQELEKMLKLADKGLVKSVQTYISRYNHKDFLFEKLTLFSDDRTPPVNY